MKDIYDKEIKHDWVYEINNRERGCRDCEEVDRKC